MSETVTATATIVFTVDVCIQCGIAFGLPPYFLRTLRESHRDFYCPNGHGQRFTVESDTERLKRLNLEAENRFQAQLNDERHARLVAEKESDKAARKLRKIERRISAGVCTCCNRTFTDLANHMKTKHKDYGIAAGREQKKLTGAA